MYKLELNNEEMHTLQLILEYVKAGKDYEPWTSLEQDLITKLIVCRLNAEDEAEAEAQAERYAMNLHSRPEGA